MYGMNTEINETEAMTKVFGWMEQLVQMSDGYVTAQQSKVIVDALTKLHDSKQISDTDYKKGMYTVLSENGFNMHMLSN